MQPTFDRLAVAVVGEHVRKAHQRGLAVGVIGVMALNRRSQAVGERPAASQHAPYERVVDAQLPDDQRTLVKTFLEFFVSERAYENSATPLHVWGSQVNASWRTRGIELFGNYSYTHPGRSSVLQGGAIARHQGTLGIGGGWRNLSGSMRVNVAGARNLEPLSRGVVAYLEKQGNRVRYADPLSASVSREIDPYAVANGAVTYQFMPGLAVQTTINNIFNASYAHPGIQDADNDRFTAQVPQPGRSAFIRLLTRF